jgi:hypothetical protein
MPQGLPTGGVELMHSPGSTTPAQPTWLDGNHYPFESRYLTLQGHRIATRSVPEPDTQ